MMGGCSSEREVSLRSGRAVLEALQRAGHHAVPLDVHDESPREIARLVGSEAIDVVFIVLHGGFGEDGRLQKVLADLHLPFTGPDETASRLAMDKSAAQALFSRVGLRVPAYRVLTRWTRWMAWGSGLGFPVVVKPVAQGSSIGVSRVGSRRELGPALALAFQYGDRVIIDRFIPGREITVSVLDGKALPIVEVVPKKGFFDFESKYQKGMTEYLVPADFPAAVTKRCQEDAVAAVNALGARHLSRVDMIVSAEGVPYILEVNTVPGMTETSLFPKAARAAGLEFERLCARLVELALNNR
jgi:D-alanine-D-alanine ligase